MDKNTIWRCINLMEALCAKDDVSSVDRKRLEETYTQVYDLLVEAATAKAEEEIPRKKTVFLDIDGVLAPGATGAIDPVLLRRFLGLLEDTGAKAVISSSWREPTLRETLRRLPRDLRLHVTGQTDALEGQPRGKEICLHLVEHPCDRYVILDDEPDGIYSFMRDKAVFTDPYKGLTEEDVRLAKRILNRP